MKKKIIGDLYNADNQKRRKAIKIIEEIIEPLLSKYLPRGLNGKRYYEVEDKLVDIIK